MKKKLYRSNDRVICGVCGGISDYFDLDATIIRVAWVLLTCFTALFFGIIAYFVCAAILPVNPEEASEDEVSRMKSAGSSSSAENSRTSADFDTYFR